MKTMKKTNRFLTFLCTATIFWACNSEIKPKPNAYLRLSYPQPEYQTTQAPCAFTYEQNAVAKITNVKDCSFQIDYPEMKAKIFVDYEKVTKNNLMNLLKDAQRLTFEHTVKAEEIQENLIIDNDKKVYGMFYELIGNTATNVQFYATDSINHFIVGSLYFYAKPNFDSIIPAAHYIKNDMLKIVETMEWDTSESIQQ